MSVVEHTPRLRLLELLQKTRIDVETLNKVKISKRPLIIAFTCNARQTQDEEEPGAKVGKKSSGSRQSCWVHNMPSSEVLGYLGEEHSTRQGRC